MLKKLKPYLFNANVREWVSLLILLAVSVFSVNYRYEVRTLYTAITGVEEHDAFDGTVMPIQEVPNWSNLSSGDVDKTYQEISTSKLIAIPEYRNDYLSYDSDLLEWGNEQDEVIRNTKYTYTVAYAGNYNFDDRGEGAGSHPAVDIVTLEATPVYAVANGIVNETGEDSGFGKYIVVKHNGVPDPQNSANATTLYSSYSHLSEFFVVEGQEVTKGEVLGQVGDTGSATTYHLHFQLDAEDAPWHPYWPFTTAEANEAGYDFWDAVNHGVGLDNLYRYTRNPLEWVQYHLDEDATLGTTPVSSVTDSTGDDVENDEGAADEASDESEEENGNENTEGDDVSESSDLISVITIGFSDLRISTPAFLMPGQNRSVSLELLNSNGEIDKNASFDGDMTLTASDENVGKLNRSSISQADFNNGVAELSLYADHDGRMTFTASVADRTYVSSPIYVISTIEPFAKFGVVHDGGFVPGKAEKIQIVPLDLNGNPTPGFYGNGTLEIDLVQGSGIFSKDKLDSKNFATGIAEISFTGENDDPVIIRVTYGTKVVESDTLVAKLFSDLSESDEYYGAVSYLFRKGTVEGYPDGTFKPTNTVSRIEALKFIFSGLDQSVQTGLTARFNDTQSGLWYSDYLATAYSLGVVQGYLDGSFRPTQGVNRVEFAKILFSTVDLPIDPVVTVDPYVDVNNLSWYAPYVAYAKENNIFPVDGQYFNPSAPMSRIEVAEVIYRMIAVQQNGASYTSLMKVE